MTQLSSVSRGNIWSGKGKSDSVTPNEPWGKVGARGEVKSDTEKTRIKEKYRAVFASINIISGLKGQIEELRSSRLLTLSNGTMTYFSISRVQIKFTE